MHIKNGFSLSSSRQMSGGSPQGTKLGNILFCVTLESLECSDEETFSVQPESADIQQHPTELNEERINVSGEYNISLESAIPNEYMSDTFDLNGILNVNLRAANNGMYDKNNELRDTVHEESVAIEGRDLNGWTLVYIDNMNIGEVHAMKKTKRHLTQNKEKRTIHAVHCEEKFEEIRRKLTRLEWSLILTKCNYYV